MDFRNELNIDCCNYFTVCIIYSGNRFLLCHIESYSKIDVTRHMKSIVIVNYCLYIGVNIYINKFVV